MAETIIRGRKRNFTAVLNSVIKDERLSLKTLGLFTLMQSFPDDWEYSVSGLSARARVGRDTIRKCLKELENAGYLLREQTHGTDGRFSGSTFVLQDEAPPLTEKPSTVKPTSVKPMTENRPQDNKHLSKETSKIPPIVPQGTERRCFVPPTVADVRTYCDQRKNGISPEAFVDYYATRGWLLGKTRMKDWKAAVRTWEHRRKADKLQSAQMADHDEEGIDGI